MNRSRVLRRLCALLLSLVPALGFAQLTVTSPEDAGPGSLRQAIHAANADPDLSLIRFDIERTRFGNGPWRIRLLTELPEIRTQTRVLGFTQPGTRAGPGALDGTYLVQIDDSAIPRHVDNLGAALAVIRGGERSLISGLVFLGGRGEGVSILLAADDAVAELNWIGVDAARGTAPVDGAAIAALHADRMRIERNLIGGSGDGAVIATGTGHSIRGNWIGFDAYGASSLSNFIGDSGVLTGSVVWLAPPRLRGLYAPTIQQRYFGMRDSTISDNWISQTHAAAITLVGTPIGTRGNLIQGNTLGRDLWGGSRAFVDTAVRLSGGAERNRVLDNRVGRANAGILLGDLSGTTPVLAGEANRLQGNTFDTVAYRAIGLEPRTAFAPLANDPEDLDTGPNQLQNSPELLFASTQGGVEGRLDAAPAGTYRIDLYSARRCHPSGRDSAEFHLGHAEVAADAAGRAVFSMRALRLPAGGLRAGQVVTATATDAAGNTSELSACLPITAAARPQVHSTVLASPMPAHGGPRNLQIDLLTNSGRTPTGEVILRVRSASAEREIARGTLDRGGLRVNAPVHGFFPFSGRFVMELEYVGDGFHLPLRTQLADLVVFRPALALEAIDTSNLVRRDVASGDYEYLSPAAQAWKKLLLDPRLPWVDGERVRSLPLDTAVAGSAGVFAGADGHGGSMALSSAFIGPGVELLDLIQIDADPRADALVEEPGTRRFRIVPCAFVPDGCERPYDLDVPIEWRYLLSGDFNGDGQHDLVFRNPSDGELQLQFMFEGRPLMTTRLRPLADEVPIAAVDLDGDGYEDLVWLDAGTGTVLVSMMQAGRVVDMARAGLPAGDWVSPGSAHLAKASDPDYGRGHLLFREINTGEVIAWRDVEVRNGLVQARPDTVLFDPAFELQRTR